MNEANRTHSVENPGIKRQLAIRGLMLDAARLVESLDYYRRFLDFCAFWKVNTVIFRLTDDQGCSMRFRSHPELVTHPNALSPNDAAGLARYAAERGIALIPEIESLGHSHYITKTAEHADLADKGDDGPAWANSLIPLHPKALTLLGDLYAEAADLFSAPYLHAGCDEANWGGSEESRKRLAGSSRAQVLAEYLNALHDRIRSLGREMIIWSDMALAKEAAVLDLIDRRIIVHDWEYAGVDPAEPAKRLALMRDKGFRAIGGPALHWCKWGPRIGGDQLRNVDAYTDAYRQANDPGVLGVIVTQWCPARYIRDSIWDSLAYAAVALDEGSAAAQADAFRRFVESHYGATWNSDWERVFTAVYASAPTRHGDQPVRLLVPWAGPEELRKAAAGPRLPPQPFEAILSDMDKLRPSVRRNLADFDAFRLSFAYLAHIYWRQTAVGECGGDAADPRFAAIVQRDTEMAKALAADWRNGRTGDPAALMPQAAAWGFSSEDWMHGKFIGVVG